MRTTIDRAGRIVIPKELRDRAGLRPGDVEIYESSAGVTIAPVSEPSRLVRGEDGRLVFAATGTPITDEMVRKLVDEDRERGLRHV